MDWVALGVMPFQQSAEGGRPGREPGSVDYRLERARLLRQVRAGEVDAADVCDAQRELLRVANSLSERAAHPCPICSERNLRYTRFVFGPRLGPGGRAVGSRAELNKIAAKRGSFRCYVVEVCTNCRWNHLLRVIPLGRTQADADSESGEQTSRRQSR